MSWTNFALVKESDVILDSTGAAWVGLTQSN